MSEERYNLIRRRRDADETVAPEEIILTDLDRATVEQLVRALAEAEDGYIYLAVPQRGNESGDRRLSWPHCRP